MPELSLDQLLTGLNEAAREYQRSVTAICGPYVREKFEDEVDKWAIGEQPTWLPDELPASMVIASEEKNELRIGGLKVERIITEKVQRDIDLLKAHWKKESIFDVIDGLIVKYVDQLKQLKAKRVSLPKVHISCEAFLVEVFLYGLACVED